MKKSNIKIVIKSHKSMINSVTIDKNLDKIKNVNFVSNKIEEVNKVIDKLQLSLNL